MKDWRRSGTLKDFIADQDGVTSIEYALLAALIFVVIVASVVVLGAAVEAMYDGVAQKVSDAVT